MSIRSPLESRFSNVDDGQFFACPVHGSFVAVVTAHTSTGARMPRMARHHGTRKSRRRDLIVVIGWMNGTMQ